jgi:tetratricopeptide (TPR) repeat protein
MPYVDTSADPRWRMAVVLVLCVSVAGCASVSSLFERVPLGGPPVSAPATTATVAKSTPAPEPAPAAQPAPVAAGPAPVASNLPLVYGSAPEAPVSPAVQHAYDEARRLMRAGNAAEAERGFRALAQSNPDLGGPHANLGALYRKADKLPEAVAEGEKAVSANPKQPVYFNQLGITYRQNGQFAKAREAYEAAIALDPAYASPYLNMGILHDLYLSDGKRALELYDKYLALSPGGDAVVAKWVADLKNRKPQPVTVSLKEKE